MPQIPEHLPTWINLILRAAGTRRTNTLDQERVETYAEEHLKLQKLTSLRDRRSVIVVTVAGQTVLVWGDAFNQVYTPGLWETWLQRRVQELSNS